MSAESEAPPGGVDTPFARPLYRWLALVILTLTFAVHSMDRAMPGILVEPVRREFHLKDSVLGLFTGSFFAIGFCVAVLPMGYLADRLNRRALLSLVMLAWSACTSLGGLTRSFTQLLLTRVAVGVAESGAAPIILPLLVDIFPARRRAFAMGVLYIGVPFGGLLASGAGGYVAAEYGWRTALLLAGVPGAILAVLTLVILREPGRGAVDNAPQEPTPTVGEVVKFLLREPGVVCVVIAGALIGLISISMIAWASSFYVRIHHLTLKQAGFVLALTIGACGMAAPPLFGWIADRASSRNPVWPLTLTWLAGVGSALAGLIWLFSPLLPLVICANIVGEFLRQGYPPLLYPVVMNRTPPNMRGAVMSVAQGATNLVGFGFGPLFVGFLSDLYGGGRAIRYAMASALGLYAIIAGLLIAATWLLRSRPAMA